jgi:hypothetical protein
VVFKPSRTADSGAGIATGDAGRRPKRARRFFLVFSGQADFPDVLQFVTTVSGAVLPARDFGNDSQRALDRR